MDIQENVSLRDYSSMGVGGDARYLVQIEAEVQIPEALAWAQERSLPVIMIGGGANIIFRDDGFDGLVLVNSIRGIDCATRNDSALITAGAGEIWDDVVADSVRGGLSGIEALSKIPGRTGAAPVQNIGAYGQDISQVLVLLRAYDTAAKQFVVLHRDNCDFTYRSSRFNRHDKGRFFITSVTMQLRQGSLQPPFYKDIQAYMEQNAVTDTSPASIRAIVTEIRKHKLPDPSVIPNCGSFFYNPIISREQYDAIVAEHPEIDEPPPGWPQAPRWFLDDGQVKLSAARLIELAGLADYDDPNTGIAIWPKQHLVLTNKSATRTSQLLEAKQTIVDAVEQKFGIVLQQEPEII